MDEKTPPPSGEITTETRRVQGVDGGGLWRKYRYWWIAGLFVLVVWGRGLLRYGCFWDLDRFATVYPQDPIVQRVAIIGMPFLILCASGIITDSYQGLGREGCRLRTTSSQLPRHAAFPSIYISMKNNQISAEELATECRYRKFQDSRGGVGRLRLGLTRSVCQIRP